MRDDLPPGVADYDAIDPDPGADPTSLSHHERRARIWQAIRQAGSPSAVHQGDLADHFGVHPSTISRDMDRIAQYVHATLGDDVELRGRAAMERAVRELFKDGKPEAAWRVTNDWLDWLHRAGARPKLADRVDARLTHERASMSTDEYVFVPGADDPADHEWVFIDDEGRVKTSDGRTGRADVEPAGDADA